MEKIAELRQGAPGPKSPGEEPMLSQDQWGAVRSLAARGLGVKRIARALGVAAKTARRYLRQGGRRPYQRSCPVRDVLERDYGEYLRRRAPEVNFCAQVLFQELRAQGYAHGYASVMRWVRPLREEERRLEEATVRFETGPGKQAQVDWGSTRVLIGERPERVHLFVLTLGYSRRLYARAYPDERLVSLLNAHERAFAHFGGRTEEILYDNPRTIVLRRDAEGKHIEWNCVFRDFADYYGFTPRLCRPYRARTKGKVESGVKYVKRNALVGRAFTSWEGLNAWLVQWATTIADERVHGTTHERPCERFVRETLQGVAGIPPYHLVRHPLRRVASDCLVNLEANRYSVPWRLVGERVEVAVAEGRVRIFHQGALVSEHPLCTGRYQVIRDAEHYRGLFRRELRSQPQATLPSMPALLWPAAAPEVQVRELSVYEALAETGGAS
jgi:transposase